LRALKINAAIMFLAAFILFYNNSEAEENI